MRLGIVTPTLNSQEFIENTITSVIDSKNYSSIDYLIVDGGSTDATVDICNKYNVKILSLPKSNMYEAINYGFKYLSADWFTYINSDDILLTDNIISSLQLINDNIDIIYGNTVYIDKNNRAIHQFLGANPNLLNGIMNAGVMPFSQSGSVFRSSLYSYLQGFSENFKYSSDFDFYIRAYLSNKKFHKVHENLSKFRIHNEQLTYNKKLEIKIENSLIIKNNFNKKPLFSVFYLYFFKLINLKSYIHRLIYKYYSIEI